MSVPHPELLAAFKVLTPKEGDLVLMVHPFGHRPEGQADAQGWLRKAYPGVFFLWAPEGYDLNLADEKTMARAGWVRDSAITDGIDKFIDDLPKPLRAYVQEHILKSRQSEVEPHPEGSGLR